MVLTNFNGSGVGFGFGVGCGFGIGWGFGGMPLSFAGLGAGGGCGVGIGLGWGFGVAFGTQYRSSQVTFPGTEFKSKEQDKEKDLKACRQTKDMASRSAFTLSQVAKHKSKNGCWLVLDGWVLNITKFLEEHPGGDVVLLEVAGNDSSKEFHAVGHSKAAQNLLLKYQVGACEGYTLPGD
ncbi:hypothetical protein MLD38_001734 [Melastoma candidum]|uniref:Uncharacterized protein n=1 Tax=Melastoma candidum TaxID=119954 RepID=A0ACB9SG63_9MYRT|nr:hypothetical protein MLD38_001734 [Melastoma candidum]